MAALLAQVPALPLHEAGKYVAGAYITLLVLVLVYVAVIALRVARIERDLAELTQDSSVALADAQQPAQPPSAQPPSAPPEPAAS
jgi:hypothetical protein